MLHQPSIYSQYNFDMDTVNFKGQCQSNVAGPGWACHNRLCMYWIKAGHEMLELSDKGVLPVHTLDCAVKATTDRDLVLDTAKFNDYSHNCRPFAFKSAVISTTRVVECMLTETFPDPIVSYRFRTACHMSSYGRSGSMQSRTCILLQNLPLHHVGPRQAILQARNEGSIPWIIEGGVENFLTHSVKH